MKIALIKISGKALNQLFESDEWIRSLKSLYNIYDGLIIVHGAGNTISSWSKALGIESTFIEGQRITSKEMMDVVAAVQSGILNTKIVSTLVSKNLNAIGLTGIDKDTFVAEPLNDKMGFVGIPKLNKSISWIIDLIKTKTIPVFSSVCRDYNGNLMNVNADIFTEVLALSIKAETVFFISDVEGVKLNGGYKAHINRHEIIDGISNGQITDGMIPKLNSCLGLLNKGINKIWIGSTIQEVNLNEHRSQSGGTWILQSA
jgi:acetylglutamate kinase